MSGRGLQNINNPNIKMNEAIKKEEFMTFCREADGKGTTHITSVKASGYVEAAILGKKECMEDWSKEDDAEHIICVGVIRVRGCKLERWDEEGIEGNKTILVKAIHRQVVVIARHRFPEKWVAYVVPVPGVNHEVEAEERWKTLGAKMPENLARAHFTGLGHLDYAE